MKQEKLIIRRVYETSRGEILVSIPKHAGIVKGDYVVIEKLTIKEIRKDE